MAFTAKGSALAHLPSGMMQVTVNYYADEEPDKVVLTHSYIVNGKAALQAKVNKQLEALKTVKDEAQDPLSVVNVVIGTI